MKKLFKVVFVEERFVDNQTGKPVFQIKLQRKENHDADDLGTGLPNQETYYRLVTEPKVKAEAEIMIDPDNYDVVELPADMKDGTTVMLKHLYNKR